MKTLAITDLIENYFKSKKLTKDVTDLNVVELMDVYSELASYLTREITDEVRNASVADLYDIQARVLKSRSSKPEICKIEVLEDKLKRKGRKPVDHGYVLYDKLSDVPVSVAKDQIYEVYTKCDGKRLNKQYAVLGKAVDAVTSRNHIRSLYAKTHNTHYMNVSLRLAIPELRRAERGIRSHKFYGTYNEMHK